MSELNATSFAFAGIKIVSPIFNSSNKIIGVLARGTGSNYEQYGRSCNDWGRGDRDKDFSAANTVKSIENIVKDLN